MSSRLIEWFEGLHFRSQRFAGRWRSQLSRRHGKKIRGLLLSGLYYSVVAPKAVSRRLRSGQDLLGRLRGRWTDNQLSTDDRSIYREMGDCGSAVFKSSLNPWEYGLYRALRRLGSELPDAEEQHAVPSGHVYNMF